MASVEQSKGRLTLVRGRTYSSAKLNVYAKPDSDTLELASPNANDSKQITRDSLSTDKSWVLCYLLMVLFALGCLTVAVRQGAFAEFALFGHGTFEPPLSEYWESGQPSLMREVAYLALDEGHKNAELTIVQDALKNKERPLVNAALIRNAFNPAWEAELTEKDRVIALTLALDALLPAEYKNLPTLSEAHPGILFAVLSTVPLSSEGILRTTKIASLGKLPEPYGLLFRELEKLGIESAGDRAVLALAHILTGAEPDEALSIYLGEGDESVVLGKIRLLALLLQSSPELSEIVWKRLIDLDSPIAAVFPWFEQEKVAEWDKVSKAQKISLASGVYKRDKFTLEQKADLLQFPLKALRDRASADILSQKRETFLSTVLFVSGQHDLTRFQVISLLSALSLEGETGNAMIAKWFETTPSTRSVLGLLLARGDAKTGDTFNFEAVRYLTGAEFEVTVGELQALTAHREPLSRALAYSLLNPNNKNERKILEGAFNEENNKSLKASLRSKLRVLEEQQ